MHPLADMIRHPTHGKNIAGAVESNRVFGIKPFAGNDFIGNRPQPSVIGLKWMLICHSLDNTKLEDGSHSSHGASGTQRCSKALKDSSCSFVRFVVVTHTDLMVS